MTRTLILAEKPSVARDIARVLNINNKSKGSLQNDKYIVTWALGHLVELAAPEEYKSDYATWKMEDLPILPKKMKISPIKSSKSQYYTVSNLLKRKDVKNIVIATDAGREGELVARWIIELSGVKKPIQRLWISSVTDKAIREGFRNLKPGKNYENLYYSARARAQADWIMGLNASRALTVKHNTSLSCGRVQTPTLNLIKLRQDEISKFIPKDYYGITISVDNKTFKFKNNKNQENFLNREFIDRVSKDIKGKKIEIVSIDSKEKKSYPGNLYDLTSLQSDANARFGFGAKETLNTLQSLYERHKVLTYPRTDSQYITSDIVGTIYERLQSMNTGSYRDYVREAMGKNFSKSMKFVNDKKVGDHHALIPTEETLRIDELNDKEFKIYDMVAKRFLENLLDPYIYEELTITGKIGDYTFSWKGTETREIGYKKIYGSEENSISHNIKSMTLKSLLPFSNIKITTGKTKAPEYFTEGTLLKAMENPFKHIEIKEKKYKNILNETGGIGTVATRADIIDKLYKNDLIEKKNEKINITAKGRQLLELVPEDLKSPILTAQWEEQLVSIEKGKLKEDVFIKDIEEFSKEIVEDIKTSNYKFKHDNMTREKCPECDNFLLRVNRKDREMLVCSNAQCKYRRTISQVTNSRCPNCHKKLKLVGSGDKKSFTCICGHRESYEAFQKRKEKQRSAMKKSEVKSYLTKQDNKNNEVNTSLADVLKDLKL